MYAPVTDLTLMSGTSLQAYVRTSYKRLVQLFGEPNGEGNNYKVSCRWVVCDGAGRVFTIYDYKVTDLYEGGLPTPAQLKELPNVEWHIGSSPENVGGVENLCQHIDKQHYVMFKL